jgi:hypothetical protein
VVQQSLASNAVYRTRSNRNRLDCGLTGRDTASGGRRDHDTGRVDPNPKAGKASCTGTRPAAEIDDNVKPGQQLNGPLSSLTDRIYFVLAILNVDVPFVPHVVTHTAIVTQICRAVVGTRSVVTSRPRASGRAIRKVIHSPAGSPRPPS